MAFLLSTGLVSDSLRDGISVNSEPMYYKAGLECDNPLSLFDLGLLYYHGVGEDQKGKDLSKALECLTASYGLMPKEYAATRNFSSLEKTGKTGKKGPPINIMAGQ